MGYISTRKRVEQDAHDGLKPLTSVQLLKFRNYSCANLLWFVRLSRLCVQLIEKRNVKMSVKKREGRGEWG